MPLSQWADIGELFIPKAPTPAQERDQIAKAIGAMESLIGLHTPTHKDLAFGLPKDDNIDHLFPGQLDCIDEAINTTTYLRLFEQSGFLSHHKVIEQAYRRSMFTQHWAGQIQEITSGKSWAVDSWFRPNGHAAIIQESTAWKDLSLIRHLRNRAQMRKQNPEQRGFWKRLFDRD